MKLEELEALVVEHASQLWNIDPKQTQLIQYTFPFVSLTDEDIENILIYKISTSIPKIERFKKITKISVSESAVKWIRYNIRKKFPNENGRGADKWISTVFIPQLGKALDDKSAPLFVNIAFAKGDLTFDTSNKDEL